ncbi:MAG: chemotaxis protein CheA [Gemmatimonadota bacterium]
MTLPARYAELFATESRDHLTLVDHALIELERSPQSREPIDALFRAVHTLKGMSGVMDYAIVGTLAHAMESRLARIRNGDEQLTPATVETLFEAADALAGSIAAAVAGNEKALDVGALVERLSQPIDALRVVESGTTATPVPVPPGPGTGLRIELEANTPLPGARAQLVLARLAGLGTVLTCLPPADQLLSDTFTGTFCVRIETALGPEQLRRQVSLAGYVRNVDVEEADAEKAPGNFEETWSEGSLSAPLQRYVRIDLRRLDDLLNLVGELVIQRGRLGALATDRGDAELDETVARTSRLIGEIQDGILGSRMVPVWQVFDRFPRVVRDGSRTLGKDVEFTLIGREIELDRVLLEQIADPLVHLLRNALDHGLEPPEERRSRGKPPRGRLALAAARERNAVVISVADDGRGIDRQKVLARGIAQGLADPETQDLSDEEVLRLISRPGFSTADQVSQVSGRGVGIDAVVSRVRSLGGRIELSSTEEKGTVFSIRLPVTLAIIPALLARVDGESYALPLTHVTETLQPGRGRFAQVRGRPVFVVRDEVLPLLDFRTVVGLPPRDVEGGQIVIIQAAERRTALVIDRLISQQEIVVKPFDAVRDALGCFSGATILPDGEAALIIDPGALEQEPTCRTS